MFCLKVELIPEKILEGIVKLTEEEQAKCLIMGYERFIEKLGNNERALIRQEDVKQTALVTRQLNENSVSIGQQGEDYVKHAIIRHFNKVETTTKTSHEGDFRVIHNGRIIIVEVKKYKAKLTTAQIDKFHNDLRTTVNNGGILISLSSAITGYNDPLHYDQDTNVMYVHSDNAELIICCIQFLLSVTDFDARSRIIEADKAIVVNAFNEIIEMINKISKTRLYLNDLREKLNSGLSKVNEDIIGIEYSIKTKIREIMPILYPNKVELTSFDKFTEHVNKLQNVFMKDYMVAPLHSMINDINTKTKIDIMWGKGSINVIARLTNESLLLITLDKTTCIISAKIDWDSFITNIKFVPKGFKIDATEIQTEFNKSTDKNTILERITSLHQILTTLTKINFR